MRARPLGLGKPSIRHFQCLSSAAKLANVLAITAWPKSIPSPFFSGLASMIRVLTKLTCVKVAGRDGLNGSLGNFSFSHRASRLDVLEYVPILFLRASCIRRAPANRIVLRVNPVQHCPEVGKPFGQVDDVSGAR